MCCTQQLQKRLGSTICINFSTAVKEISEDFYYVIDSFWRASWVLDSECLQVEKNMLSFLSPHLKLSGWGAESVLCGV